MLVVVALLIADSNLAGANDFLRSVAVEGSSDEDGRASVICTGVVDLFSAGGRSEDEERTILVVRFFSSPDFVGRNAGGTIASCFALALHKIVLMPKEENDL